MAFLRKKKSRGKTYYYVAESKRVNGKPRVVNEVYVGTIERIRELALGYQRSGVPEKIQVLEWGSIAAVEAIEKEIGLIDIVNHHVPKRKQGLSIGEYIYLSVMNRCISPKSKRALGDWLKKRAIFDFRAVDLSLISSQRYWDNFSMVDEAAIENISTSVAEQVMSLYHLEPDWMLFDTTNYYTFMDVQTPSEISIAGHNKQGRHNLRQVGVALMVDRQEGIPFYHKVFPGNMHDSKLFQFLTDELFSLLHRFGKTKDKLTLVFDKGINAQETMARIDDDLKIHFITSYSPYHAQKLVSTDTRQFSPLSGSVNEGRMEGEIITAYRKTMSLWGKERTVVVTHNPKTARKKEYRFDEKLSFVRQNLLEMRRKVRENAPQWRKEETVRQRVYDLLTEQKMKPYFTTTLKKKKGKLTFSFRQIPYQVKKAKKRMGKQIIVTDRSDLTTEEIVSAYLERHRIEDCYRAMKSPYKISFMPQYHWTDQKVRVHILTCTLALTYLAVMQLKLKKARIEESIDTIMQELRDVHSCLLFNSKSGKPIRQLEQMSSLQKKALDALKKQNT